ncbi:MAG: hypothetical protein NTU97_00460 [Candidatus Magasanikbacteria bacterium]|nr:hypothetical protein [Candidatus Magasanikbacteria bacterium]
MFKFIKNTILLCLLSIFVLPTPILAQIAAVDGPVDPLFNPNHIISDKEMVDYNCMTLEEVDLFLKNKPGSLSQYEIIDPLTGMNKKAAEIIYKASQDYKISPKVLLVLLQKEQSLVENPSPTQYNLDWAAGYARCDSCGPLDPLALKYKGFAKQVDGAAGALRYYLDAANQNWLKKVGIIYNIDSIPVIPVNLATAGLYTYTPHFRGNYNFWRIWNRWFSQKLPDGLLVQVRDTDQIYLIQNGILFPFKNKVVFLSRFSLKSVTLVNQKDLDSYKIGAELKFLNYSLVKTDKTHTYLLVNDKKRLVDKASFRYYGFDTDEVVTGTEEDLAAYTESDPVSTKAVYPLGALMLDTKNKTYYLVEDGIKHAIYDKELIKINFPSKKIRNTTALALKKYKDGDPLLFNDGTWIKTADSADVYIVSNGSRRPIKDELTFNTLGGAGQNIIIINEKTMAAHPIGEPISFTSEATTLTQASN